MATVTKGRTFVSGETVTPAKLNELVDSATVTGIVDADISASADIAGSKLADSAVTTAKINNAAVTAAKLDGAQTGSAPIYGCRAWVNFDGTRNEADTGASTNGANVKIRASGNVSSVLKNTSGEFTLNFATALPDSNYAVVFGHAAPNNNTSNMKVLTATSTSSELPTLMSTTSVRVGFFPSEDIKNVYVAIFR